MSNKFWVEVVNNFVYLLNRLPTMALNNKASYEAWNGVKLSMHHLKVFRSICYYQVPKQKRSKLDNRA